MADSPSDHDDFSHSDDDILGELGFSDWRKPAAQPSTKSSPYVDIIEGMLSRPGKPAEVLEVPKPPPPTRDTSGPRLSRRIPREVTYEIMQASPDLVAAFKDARAEYADAIYTWWHRSAPRERWEEVTDLDCQLARLDPRVQRAEKALSDADRKLSAHGKQLKIESLRNDGTARRLMVIEADRLNEEWYATHPHPMPPISLRSHPNPAIRHSETATAPKQASALAGLPPRRPQGRRTASARSTVEPSTRATDTPRSSTSSLTPESAGEETAATTPEADISDHGESARHHVLQAEEAPEPQPLPPAKSGRPRGRPRKRPLPLPEMPPPVKRGRGRPPKQRPEQKSAL